MPALQRMLKVLLTSFCARFQSICFTVCVYVISLILLFGFQIARTKCVIGDPSYFPDKVKKVGQVSSSTYTSTEHTAHCHSNGGGGASSVIITFNFKAKCWGKIY